MGSREQSAWNEFAISLGISDVFHIDDFRRISTKQYTWIRENPTPKWSKIDRFYITAKLQECGGTQGIWQQLAHLSDHSATFLSLNLSQHRASPGPPHFDTGLLRNKDFKEAHLRACAEAFAEQEGQSRSIQVAKALEALMQENVRISRQRKKIGRATYQAQFHEVREAEELIARDWNDLSAWERLNLAQEKLEEVRMEKIERKKNYAGALWAKFGDKCLKDFFDFHKVARPKTIIRELQDGPRSLKSSGEISDHVHAFYKELYRSTL